MKTARPADVRSNLIKPVLVSTSFLFAFLLISLVGASLRFEPWTASWYLPSGMVFALLLICGPVYSPLVFATNLITLLWVYHARFNLSLILMSFTITAGYALTAAGLRHLFGRRFSLGALRETTYFILASLFTPLALAALTDVMLDLRIDQYTHVYIPTFFQLWVEDALNNLALGAFLITLFDGHISLRSGWLPRMKADLPKILLALAQAACILATTWVVFGLSETDDRRLWYLFFLPLSWTILQFGIYGASASVLGIVSASALAIRLFDYPLVVFEDLQIFLLMLALTGLVTGAAFSELWRAQHRLRNRLDMESRITAISTRFINLRADQVDDEIRQAIQSIGSFCGSDGSHLMLFHLRGGILNVQRAFEWTADPRKARAARLEGMPLTRLPYLMKKLEAGECFYAPSLAALPREAGVEKEYMQKHGLSSMLTVPILYGNRLVGSLGFHSTHGEQVWAEEDVRLVSLLGETFLSVLERQRVENMARESERKFRSVILQSYDGVILVNEHAQVIEWNNGMERITGLGRNEVLGRPIWDLQYQLAPVEKRTPGLIQKLKQMNESFQKDGAGPWVNRLTETLILTSTGDLRNMQTLTFPIQTGRGFMTGTIARDVTELRRGEVELRRNQARLAEAERLAHLGHFQIAIPGGQMEWSEESYRICEWDPANPLPPVNSVIEDIHPEDRPRILEAFDQALQTRTSFDVEYRILLSETRIKHIHTIGQVITDARGEVTHVFGTMMDVTERQSAVEALRESEARYRQLADSISDVFFALDNNLVITYWNRTSEKLTGFTVENAVGKPLFTLFPNLKGSSVEQFVVEAFRSQQQQGFVMEHRTRGKKLYLEVSTYPFDTGLAVFLRDVTERQTSEERLRQSEARYRAVVEDQTDLICRFTPAGIVTFANEAYCRCYARPRRDLVGHFFVRYISSPARNDLSGQYTSLVRSRAVSYEYQAVLPDGKLHWLQWTDRPIFNDEGKIIEYQSVGRDISDSKRLEEELRYLSTHDALTGIYNRSFFEAELSRLQRGRSWPVSILMVDVNGLKSTNDTRGHPVGDELLKCAASVLSACFRPGDIVARFGGDEFAVLLPCTDGYAAEEVLRRVRLNVDAYNRANSGEPPLSLSIGIATGEKGQALVEVLSRADTRMYQDKVRQKRTGELRLN